jgi:hypothetical protein
VLVGGCTDFVSCIPFDPVCFLFLFFLIPLLYAVVAGVACALYSASAVRLRAMLTRLAPCLFAIVLFSAVASLGGCIFFFVRSPHYALC